MSYRMFYVAVITASLFAGAPAWAAKNAEEITHDGKFVSLVGEKLTMTNAKGKEHTHMMAFDAKITCDSKVCKATDLKSGMKIRVTTTKSDKKVATHIEAIEMHEMFANTHDGKFVSLAGHKLAMVDVKGKEHTHTLAKNATITCDGETCKAEHLKNGMKIRVSTEKDDPTIATHVEAIEKHADFGQHE